MRIISINEEPATEVPFLNAGRRPGQYYVDQLPVHDAFVDCLPADLVALRGTQVLNVDARVVIRRAVEPDHNGCK